MTHASGESAYFVGIFQNKYRELRYARNCEFTDVVVADYMKHLMPPKEIERMLESRDLGMF